MTRPVMGSVVAFMERALPHEALVVGTGVCCGPLLHDAWDGQWWVQVTVPGFEFRRWVPMSLVLEVV